MTLVTRPSMTDDTGTGQDGTVVNEALVDAVLDQIDDQNHSTTNPTIKPKATTDEVVAARGSKASLDARLDVSLEEDGTLKEQASLVTNTVLVRQTGRNFWQDSLFDLWPDGDSSAPYGWTLSGTGAAVARCGVGPTEASAPADTTQLKHGRFCAKLTYGSSTAKLTRSFSASLPTGFRSKKVVVGIRCKASVANLASLIVDDGVTTTRGGSDGNATYHDGDGTDQWIYAVHTLSASATKLDVQLEVAQSGSAYFSGGIIEFADQAREDWFPERRGWMIAHQQIRGSLAVADGQNSWALKFDLPAILVGMNGSVGTAPVGAAIIFDAEKSTDRSSWNSPWAAGTLPTIADGAKPMTTSPDPPTGTYAYRCFEPGDYFRFNVDQVGSGTAGAEATLSFKFLVSLNEFDLLGLA